MLFWVYSILHCEFITGHSAGCNRTPDASSSSKREHPEHKSQWHQTTGVWHEIQNNSLSEIPGSHSGFVGNSDLLRSDGTRRIRNAANHSVVRIRASWINKDTRQSANRYWNQIWQHGSPSFSELLLSLSKEIVPRNGPVNVCLSFQTTFKPSEPEFMQLQCRTTQATMLLYCCSQLGTAHRMLRALCCAKTCLFARLQTKTISFRS
jgi:hypothetical protein